MSPKNRILLKLIPIMLTFFAMGFIDLVGIATNYVKADFLSPIPLPTCSLPWFFFGFNLLGSNRNADEQNRAPQNRADQPCSDAGSNDFAVNRL